MEFNILKELEFEVTIVSPLCFLERYAKITNSNKTAFFLAQYILEISLLEHKFLIYKPSVLAASAISLAVRILKIDQVQDLKFWPNFNFK